ncbi:Gup1p [Malassezia vespertilionis]|uniref:Gup1p n=1 Tax=Malassezia vespertilionis TaxID=2020962 RepID=A0A2N1JG10_9BASI|nr:Gup1p [Malassezia vespertilionis]
MLPMHTEPMKQPQPQPSPIKGMEPMEIEDMPELSRWRSRGITLLTVDPYLTEAPDAPKRNPDGLLPTPPPSRWWTKEFFLYFIVCITAIPYMIYVPIRLSYASSNANYDKYARYLVPGWMHGRLRDNSDYQYRAIREYMPILFMLIGVYSIASHCVRICARTATRDPSRHRTLRKVFLCVTGIVCVTALHGVNMPKLLLLALGNYVLLHTAARHCSNNMVTGIVWVYNCAALGFVFYTNGIPYASISPQLAWLDAHAGLLPRWYISYNFSMLRLVSYALDYTRAICGYEPTDTHALCNMNARARVQQHRALDEYGLQNYLLYLSYPPLFIAGPILTYNDFVAQLVHPLRLKLVRVLEYALRCAILLLAMEFILHYMYVNAIKNSRAWEGSTPMELSMIGFWNLIFVWLKLLIPWRIFRLWALLDGVDTPENMIRAMFNNYSGMGFWRSWHKTTLLVFTFVALWHDLSFTLLAWGWLVTFFIAPEVIATYLLPQAKFGNRAWYRHVCAIGGAMNVQTMMTANLVGFVVGLDGIQYIWSQLTGSWAGIGYTA